MAVGAKLRRNRKVDTVHPNVRLLLMAVLCVAGGWGASVQAACPLEERTFERPACPSSHPYLHGTTCASYRSRCTWPSPCSVCALATCNTCTAEETLDVARGVCVRTERVDPGRPACPPTQPYLHGTTCTSYRTRCTWPSPCSVCALETCNTCRPDEVLDTVDGQCCPAR